MARILYHILDYEHPERVARLINQIQTKSDFVRVHLDTIIGKQKFGEYKQIIEEKCEEWSVDIVSKFRCKYGSFGQVDAVLSAMRAYDDYNYDYFITLSGDSYPLKPPEIMKSELDGRNCALIEFFELPYSGWYNGGLFRLSNRFYFIPIRKYPYVRTFSFPRFIKRLPLDLKPYGGRGSLCLQKRHVRYILEFVEKNPTVKKFFKRVWAPDETFYTTILLNSPLASSIVNESTMYFDYSEGLSHPKVLTLVDLAALKNSGKFFARKFSIDDSVLDLIDQELKNYQTTQTINTKDMLPEKSTLLC